MPVIVTSTHTHTHKQEHCTSTNNKTILSSSTLTKDTKYFWTPACQFKFKFRKAMSVCFICMFGLLCYCTNMLLLITKWALSYSVCVHSVDTHRHCCFCLSCCHEPHGKAEPPLELVRSHPLPGRGGSAVCVSVCLSDVVLWTCSWISANTSHAGAERCSTVHSRLHILPNIYTQRGREHMGVCVLFVLLPVETWNWNKTTWVCN